MVLVFAGHADAEGNGFATHGLGDARFARAFRLTNPRQRAAG
jgi:hypothetical protein